MVASFLSVYEKLNSDATTYAKYTYLWDGTKLGAVDSDGNGLCYLGSLVYRRENTRHGGPVEGGSIQLKIPVFPRYIYSLESAGFEGGRIVALTTAQGTTYKSHYHVTDHLGSVRVVVDEDRNVLERSDYLPYGKRCSGGELSDNRYRYNGKEEQAFVENPYLDYGARMYDPDNRLSWTTPDPLAEKYYSISPYAFCAGNPINFIDPNGMDWYSYQEEYEDEDGKIRTRTQYKYTKLKSQAALDEAEIEGKYLGETVVTFDGSYNERLGTKENSEGLYINGDGAITAHVTVYGPNGENDIQTYTGFTMTSNFEKFGAIDNGEYTVNYVLPGKKGALPSNYAVNGGNPVNCLNGINPSLINPYSAYQKNGIYIHATNRSGLAGGTINASTGCLLIQGGSQWERFKAQIGPRDFRLILNRY